MTLDEEIQILQDLGYTVVIDEYQQFIIFEGFKLPTIWILDKTDILVKIPLGYPATPLYAFYVPHDFLVNTGKEIIGNFELTAEHINKKSWNRFSISPVIWEPNAIDISKGSGLHTFVNDILKRLQTIE